MTKRFLAGLHPGFGTMGIWLSQPGVDVSLSGPAANFILRPDIKYEQVMMSGVVVVGPGTFVDVLLPTSLPKHPYILVHGNISSSVEYPSDLGAAGGTGANPNEVNFVPVIDIAHNKLTFYNSNEQYTLCGFYMVFNRSIGS